DLIEPRSVLSGAEPVERETTHWYLPLGELQPRLEAWIAEKDDWKPTVLGQVRSWFNDGLTDRAMTRDLPWGVPVPPEVEGAAEGKVLYVWFDAPIGYVHHEGVGGEAGRPRALAPLLAGPPRRHRAPPRPLHREGQHRLPHAHL